jgi:hypothetical protein
MGSDDLEVSIDKDVVRVVDVATAVTELQDTVDGAPRGAHPERLP